MHSQNRIWLVYRDGGIEHYIDDYVIESIQEDSDYEYLMKFLDNVDLVEKRFLIFAGINEHIVRYFMLAADNNDIVYEWNTNEDTVREFGALFDFLKYCREITTSQITGQNGNDFKELTTGRLL